MSTLTPELDRSAGLLGTLWHGDDVPCRTNDAELWFAETPEGVAQAQRLCGDCPVRASCLAGALDRREPWGVWGGELFERGVPVARKRRPGRPRKDDDQHRLAAEQALADRLTGGDDDLDLLTADRVDDGAAA